jgi:hypothetical protein
VGITSDWPYVAIGGSATALAVVTRATARRPALAAPALATRARENWWRALRALAAGARMAPAPAREAVAAEADISTDGVSRAATVSALDKELCE